MVGFLVLLSVLAGVVGFMLLTEATLGAGIIGVACLLGVLARLAQADQHHKTLMRESQSQAGESQGMAEGFTSF